MNTLGVDLGGTSMRAALYHGAIEKVRAEAPGRPMRAGEGAALAAQVGDLIRPMLTKLNIVRADVLVVGAAGAGHESEHDELQKALEAQRLAWRVNTFTDAELARLAAFAGGPGVLLIAGTGSIAISRDKAGRDRRVGGLGWRMGDQGSAHWLGAKALEAVGAMNDQMGPHTQLAKALAVAVGAQGIAGLVRWSVSATPAQVAALGPSVLAAASKGDAVAKALRASAVEALAGMAMAAGAADMPVAFSGGLLTAQRPLRTAVAAALKARGVQVITKEIDPCRGALTARD
jgi:glucosamine kinase